MEKKRAKYKISPELNQKLSDYARAKGQSQTKMTAHIIEHHFSCKDFSSKIKDLYLNNRSIEKKNQEGWKLKDHPLPSDQYSKIKYIARNCDVTVSDIIEDMLSSYLSKVNPSEVFERNLEKVFNQS